MWNKKGQINCENKQTKKTHQQPGGCEKRTFFFLATDISISRVFIDSDTVPISLGLCVCTYVFFFFFP